MTAPVATIPALRPELRARLLRTCLAHAPSSLAALDKAIVARDGTALALLAHSLKSGSANVGEAEAATCCRELEVAARAGQIDRCAGLVRRFAGLLATLQVSVTRQATARSRAL